MDKDTIKQLAKLRDFIVDNRSTIDPATIENSTVDYVLDTNLRRCLTTPIVSRAIYETLLHSTDERDQHIVRLYEYFTVSNNKDESEALELIRYTLFLGGVDNKLRQVSKPSKARRGGSKSRVAGIVVAAILLLAIILTIRNCSEQNTSESNMYSSVDVCRIYDGTIVYNGVETAFRMSISVIDSGKFSIKLTNTYQYDDTRTYTGHIKKATLVLDDGPDLSIEKTSNGKIKMSCETNKSGKWTFISTTRVI